MTWKAEGIRIAAWGATGDRLVAPTSLIAREKRRISSAAGSDFEPGSFPCGAKYSTVLVMATGDREANLVDHTEAQGIRNGENRVVVQKFVVADPGVGEDRTR
ncbi:hypothetical protein J7L84_01220, partial [Candidatus Bipolaricaulota bacterium]|nr:hypothetical protein [Candidatus Bipolaricaulota bacterium]